MPDPMTMAALGSAGIGAIGGFLGGNEEHIGPGDLYPDWMKGLRRDLSQNIGNLPGRQAYQGDWVSAMNPYLSGSLADMYGWGQPGGMGYGATQNMLGTGQDLMGIGMDQIGRMAAQGPNQFQYDQGTYDQSFANLSGGLQNQFDLGARNIARGFNWDFLPGLNMQQALAGGGGNTKFGQAGALGQAMADQNVMQFGTDLWTNAANRADVNAMSAGGQNLGSANAFDARMMNLVPQGANMLNTGYNMGANMLGLGNQAGTQQQAYDQSVADAARMKWDMEQNLPWQDQVDRLNQMKMFEMGSMPATTGMSGWEGAIQGGLAGLGIFDAYNQIANPFGAPNVFSGTSQSNYYPVGVSPQHTAWYPGG